MTAAPTTFGRHHVIALLGRGGMANVYLTVVPGPAGVQKLLVLKELRADVSDRLDARGMFLAEARLATRLNHPNVVQSYEFGEEAGRLFLTMEYLEGQSLERILRRVGRDALPLEVHLRVLADVLAGLEYAHDLADFDGTPLNIVHRDVSPHNVIVTYDGQVKVVDFGIAKSAGVTSEATRAGVFKGKARYASPEQALGQPLDRRSDVFAVGVMLWEALTRERFWGEKSEVAVLLGLAQGSWPRPGDVRADVPPMLDAICARALARNPDDRFASAAEMQHAIEAWLDEENTRVTSRRIGGWLNELFADERATLRGKIDAQIRALASAQPPAEIPVLAEDTRDADSSPPVTPVERSAPARASRRPVRVAALGVAAAAIAIGALASIQRTPHGSSDRIGAAATTAASAVPSAVAAARPEGSTGDAPATIPLRVRATPPEARLFLDDAPLPSNPIERDVPRDGRPHRLRATAPGWLPAEQTVTFDEPVSASLALGRVAVVPAARPPSRAAARAQPPPPPSDPPPEPRPARPKLSVDEANPYAK